MPITPPDIRATIASILKRLDALERRLAAFARRRSVLDIPFARDGSVTVSTSQPYYLAEPGGTAFEIVGSLRQSGTATTTAVLQKNGNTVATISMASGEVGPKVVDLEVDYKGNQDRMNVAVTTAGGGAAGLDIQVRVKVST